ncbi:MAG: hypothetical protein NTZ04_04795 [Chloroflexi bacterium]|nr:hypothetical protein [Chloroflexota bacterium]
MRKLSLAIVLILMLVGSAVGGMAVATSAPAGPTLKANGSSAPGTIFVSGSYWALGAQVDIWMDVQDAAHYVVVVSPSGSKGNFSTSFVVGPTALGEHWIIAVQAGDPEKTVKASFFIKSTQPLDDRTAGIMEEIVKDPEIGLAMFDSAYGRECWTQSGTYGIETTYDGIRHVSLTICVAELSGLLNRDSVKVEIHLYSPVTAQPAIPSGWCELDTIYSNGMKVYEFDSDGWRITGNVKHPNVLCTYNATTIGHNEPVPVGPICVQSYEPGLEYADE